MTLSSEQVKEYRALKESGVAVSKHNKIVPNDGSETSIHLTSKSLIALLGIRNGYRVDSEVPVQYNGSEKYIDILLWGHDSRLTYAVEPDHTLTSEKKDRKKSQYVDHTAVQDILFVDLTDCPQNITDAFGWLGNELGLEP